MFSSNYVYRSHSMLILSTVIVYLLNISKIYRYERNIGIYMFILIVNKFSCQFFSVEAVRSSGLKTEER